MLTVMIVVVVVVVEIMWVIFGGGDGLDSCGSGYVWWVAAVRQFLQYGSPTTGLAYHLKPST